MSCSSDSGGDEPKITGSFKYTVSGAASKTVEGDNAKFGPTGSFDQTFISLVVGTDELDIRLVIDPVATGGFEVNPMVVQENGGQIVNIPIEAGDSWADLGIGSTISSDRRNFSTNSANGGLVTITKAEADLLEGTFNVSMMELLSGGTIFDNPKVTVQGSFTAIRQ